MMVLSLFGERILLTLGQAPHRPISLKISVRSGWGLTPALWFPAIRGFMRGHRRSRR